MDRTSRNAAAFLPLPRSIRPRWFMLSMLSSRQVTVPRLVVSLRLRSCDTTGSRGGVADQRDNVPVLGIKRRLAVGRAKDLDLGQGVALEAFVVFALSDDEELVSLAFACLGDEPRPPTVAVPDQKRGLVSHPPVEFPTDVDLARPRRPDTESGAAIDKVGPHRRK